MKKIVYILLVIVLLAMVAAFLIHRATRYQPRGAELVPAETVFFVHLPDLRATAERFRQTELFKLGEEPEVQAFLAQPRAKVPQRAEWQKWIDQVERTAPRELFFAVTSIEGAMPRLVAGFSFHGNRRAAEDLLAQPLEMLKRTRPAGKADLANYAGVEIELFTDNELTIAHAFHREWCFIATDVQLLERTLDRHAGRVDPRSMTLANEETFQKTLGRLPEMREGLVFAQVGRLVERLAALFATARHPAAKELELLAKVRAIGAAVKLEGGQCRDTIFAYAPGSSEESPLRRESLALSSAGTLFYYAAALPAQLELPPEAMTMVGSLLPAFAGFSEALSKQGLSLAELGTAFGPEIGTVVDWPQQMLQPALVLAVDVRDSAKANAFLNVMASGAAGTPPWVRTESGGVTHFQIPQVVPSVTAPALALTEKFLLLGLNSATVNDAIQRLGSTEPKLGETPAFRAAEQSVGRATSAYGYLDLRGLFERFYGTFRPILAMSLAFMPAAGEYVDASKLPSTEAISRHLGTIVFSQSSSPDGMLLESTGTLTFTQALVGALSGSVTAILPKLGKGMSGEALDPAKLLGFPEPAASPSRPNTPSGDSEAATGAEPAAQEPVPREAAPSAKPPESPAPAPPPNPAPSGANEA